MKTYKPIKDLPKYQANPFIENALIKVEENTVHKRKFAKGTKGVVQSIVNQDGEITGQTAFIQQIEVDEEKFAKLYLSQFCAFWELSKPAIRVFGHIITNCLIPNKDEFYFNIEEALEYTGYTSNRYILTGLSILCEQEIIARSNMPYKFFINPLVVFNGSRVTFAKTYVKKKAKKSKKEDEKQMNLPFSEDFE